MRPATAQVFSDVPRSHWASMEAEWLASRGLVEGWGGRLHGEQAVNRYQAVEFLYRVTREFEDYQMVVDARLERLEKTQATLETKVDQLFETAGTGGLRTPPKMQRYQANLRTQRTGSGGGVQDLDAGVVQRLRVMHERVGAIRAQGVRSPVLVVPPGAHAFVSLPEVLMDDRPARFGEGVHVLHWGARLEVPVGSTVSLLLPDETGGLMLLERTRGVLRAEGFHAESGSPAPVTVDAAD